MLNKGIIAITIGLLGLALLGGCAANKPKETDETALAMGGEQTAPGVMAAHLLDDASHNEQMPPSASHAQDEIGDYRIGPQDLLEIQVFGADELSRTVRVNSRGSISLPLVGLVPAAGLTSEELEAVIAAELAKNYLQDPHVNIFIQEYTSQRVAIEGAVNKPGVYPLTGPTTLLQAMAIVGGMTNVGNPSDVRLFRSGPQNGKQVMVFNIKEIRNGKAEDPLLEGNDIVLVGQSTGRAIARDIIDFVLPFRHLRYGY